MKQITLDYKGIDRWNRPCFKVTGSKIDSPLYVGSVDTLFDYITPRKEVVKYFKKNKQELVIMGKHFGCEPLGSPIKKSLKIRFKK